MDWNFILQFLGWFAFFALFLSYLFSTDARRKRRYGWISIALAVGLSIHAATPLSDRPFLPFFEKEATNKDKAFEELMADVHKKTEGFSGSEFILLRDAVNARATLTAQATATVPAIPAVPVVFNLQRYFPDITAPQRAKTPTAVNEAILLEVQRRAGGKIRLGLDLKGGSSFLLKIESTDPGALEQVKSVLIKRISNLKSGLAEPIVQPVGDNRILIQLPGVSEAAREEARRTVQQQAYLEFRLVHPNNEALAVEALKDPHFKEPGYERFYHEKETDAAGNKAIYFLEKKVGLKGDQLEIARPDMSEHGGYSVRFQLKSEGRDQFARLTEENIRRRLAIVLDGEVVSAPSINTPITAGSGEITGNFSREEAIQLANVLNNPLGTPLQLIEERNVDASLGADSIRSGVTAALYGAIAIIVFMTIYYMLSGIIANIALILNNVILVGIMAMFGSTLTMPGIAGIVLALGMSVDTNVLINERIREELNGGKGLRAAISAGYDKVFWTIFDSHVTTLITAFILFFLGSGPVKGFGITLAIGLLVNLFTAIVVTRLIVDFLVDKGWVKSLPMLHIIRSTSIDFLKYRFIAIGASAVIILVGMFSFVQRGGLDGLLPKGFVSEKIIAGVHTVIPRRGIDIYGLDFKGGEAVTLEFKQRQGEDAISKALERAGYKDPFIQYQRELATGRETLQIKVPLAQEGNPMPSVVEALNDANSGVATGQFKEISRETVGSVVGAELKGKAFLALFVSCVLILIYVALRFELSNGMGGIVALVHDVLVTVGLFALTGRQFSLPMVAAILTIIGFSINDTIVIFDRVREDIKLYGARMSRRDIINRALNETLSRTIITSGTVLMATLALFIWGGGVLNDFAFTFLVGIIAGSYSTIFIAGAVVLWWHDRQERRGKPATIGSEANVAQRA